MLKTAGSVEHYKQIQMYKCWFEGNRGNQYGQAGAIGDSSEYESNYDIDVNQSQFIDNYGYSKCPSFS